MTGFPTDDALGVDNVLGVHAALGATAWRDELGAADAFGAKVIRAMVAIATVSVKDLTDGRMTLPKKRIRVDNRQ